VSSFLIISHTHGLLPLAWRLTCEGSDVQVIIDRDSYEKRAWQGKLTTILKRGGKHQRNDREAVRTKAENEERIVLTDSPRWAPDFAGYPHLFAMVARPEGAPPLPAQLLGAWFDGEQFSARHLLAEDQGLWPGGLGPAVPGGLTLINPRHWPTTFEDALDRIKDELKAQGYRGLVKVGVLLKPPPEGDESEGPEAVVLGYQAGWNHLQTHALLAEAGDGGTPTITEALTGEAEPQLWHRFTVVVPVSIPPYPYRAASSERSANLPIPEPAVQCGKVFWHDMCVEDGVVKTAGLDGLVGVVRASADNLSLALAQVRGWAGLFRLPELQVRVDVGASVDHWLGQLESVGLTV